MRLLSKFIWFLAFLVATFVWMVLFEHGFSVDGFRSGASQEWHDLVDRVKDAQTPADTPSSEATPSETKP